MKTKLALSLSAIVAACLAATAYADHRGPGPGMGLDGPMMERIFDRLDLTEDQRQTIEGIMDSFRPQLRALRESGQTVRESLANTSPSSPDYDNVVATASQRAAETAAELITTAAAMRAEVEAVLTEEQRAQAAELRQEFAERRKSRRERLRKRFGEGSGPE